MPNADPPNTALLNTDLPNTDLPNTGTSTRYGSLALAEQSTPEQRR